MSVTVLSSLTSTALTANYVAASGTIQVISTGAPMPAAAPFTVYLCDQSTGIVIVVLRVTSITDGTHYAVTPQGVDTGAASGSICVLSYVPLFSIRSTGDFSVLGSPTSSAIALNGNTIQISIIPSGAEVEGYQATIPGTGASCDIRALVFGTNPTGNSRQIGIFVRVNGSGKLITFCFEEDQGPSYTIDSWNSVSSFAGRLFPTLSSSNPTPGLPAWVRITSDGTTLKFFIGDVYGNWYQIFSQAVATFLGAAPDRAGLCGWQNGTNPWVGWGFNLQISGT